MLARLKSELAYARGLLCGVARTRVVGAAPTKTLGDYFEEWSLRHGDRPALGGDGKSFSYRQLDARANRYARWARGKGLGKGDVVALDDDEPSRISRDLARLRARRSGRRADQHQPDRSFARPLLSPP